MENHPSEKPATCVLTTWTVGRGQLETEYPNIGRWVEESVSWIIFLGRFSSQAKLKHACLGFYEECTPCPPFSSRCPVSDGGSCSGTCDMPLFLCLPRSHLTPFLWTGLSFLLKGQILQKKTNEVAAINNVRIHISYIYNIIYCKEIYHSIYNIYIYTFNYIHIIYRSSPIRTPDNPVGYVLMLWVLCLSIRINGSWALEFEGFLVELKRRFQGWQPIKPIWAMKFQGPWLFRYIYIYIYVYTYI